MPLYDYSCSECGRTEERWFANFAEVQAKETHPIPCKPDTRKCKGFMRRKVSAPNFSITGFNAKNGYTGSKP